LVVADGPEEVVAGQVVVAVLAGLVVEAAAEVAPAADGKLYWYERICD
jgi:hypothetical protein